MSILVSLRFPQLHFGVIKVSPGVFLGALGVSMSILVSLSCPQFYLVSLRRSSVYFCVLKMSSGLFFLCVCAQCVPRSIF